jgi:antitoxin ParD1/3/4
MSISVNPVLEAKIRQKAGSEGMTIEAYVERLLLADEKAEEELERLALEGLNSGEPIEITSRYWEEQHRRLDQRLNKSGIQ